MSLTNTSASAYIGHHRHAHIQDWGVIDYKKAWDRQTELHDEIKNNKIHKQGKLLHDKLIFCEHPSVFTLGKSGKEENLLMNTDWLKSIGIDFYKINRGGDITYHGPGQIVMYPILDLDRYFNDVHRYVRTLEEIIIKTLHDYHIDSFRNPTFTGVWLISRLDRQPKKICALGVHMSRWVTLHGIAFNVLTDLTPFDYIVPCGIKDPEKGVTSLHLETDQSIVRSEVLERVQYHFAKEFDCIYI